MVWNENSCRRILITVFVIRINFSPLFCVLNSKSSHHPHYLCVANAEQIFFLSRQYQSQVKSFKCLFTLAIQRHVPTTAPANYSDCRCFWCKINVFMSIFHIEPSNITLNKQYESQQSNVILFAFETRDKNKLNTMYVCKRCMESRDIDGYWCRYKMREREKSKTRRTFPFHMDVLSKCKQNNVSSPLTLNNKQKSFACPFL